MSRPDPPQCEVSLNERDCEGDNLTQRLHCYPCGNRVCGSCSHLVFGYVNGHRVRMCLDCQEDKRAEFRRGEIRRVS